MVIEDILKTAKLLSNIYTTIHKKQDRDYYGSVKVAHVAETSEANNGHYTLYLSPAGRAIVTGVKCK